MKASSLLFPSLVGLLGFVAFTGCAEGSADTPGDPIPPDAEVTTDGGGTTAPDGAKPPPVKCTPGQCPINSWDLDGKKDGENCGCEYQCTKKGEDDAFDIGFVDANCDGSDGIVSECVYVSTSIGDDGGDGTRQKPVKTIGKAIVIAGAGTKKRPVCVSAEKYTEAVELPSGVSLYGGFDQADTAFPFRRSFKHGSQDIATTIVAPSTGASAGTGVFVREILQEMHVENITFEVSIGAAQNGQSVYGVRAQGGTGQLFVRKNVFVLGNANPGADGTSATVISPAVANNGIGGGGGCSNCSGFGTGGAAPSCSAPGGRGGNGANGSNGNGAPGSAGFGGAGGGAGGGGIACITSGSGAGGSGGADGSQGIPAATGGTGAVSLGTIVGGLYVSSDGAPGISGGNGGGGGGGGGGGSSSHSWPFCDADGAGGGGSGGCGGLGGSPGQAGKGGGSVIGVLVGNAAAVIEANTFTLGNGGVGGKGGNGVAGQAGGTGIGGGGGGQSAGAGGKGGNGGSGAGGGGGGGGSGGHSVRVARLTASTVTETTNIGTLGTAGLGGDGGSAGSNGRAGTKGVGGLAKEVLVVGN